MFKDNPSGQTHYDPEAERLARTSAQSDVDAARARFEKSLLGKHKAPDTYRIHYQESDFRLWLSGYQAGLAAREEWQPNNEKQRIISELLSKANEAHEERDYARESRLRDAASSVYYC